MYSISFHTSLSLLNVLCLFVINSTFLYVWHANAGLYFELLLLFRSIFFFYLLIVHEILDVM